MFRLVHLSAMLAPWGLSACADGAPFDATTSDTATVAPESADTADDASPPDTADGPTLDPRVQDVDVDLTSLQLVDLDASDAQLDGDGVAWSPAVRTLQSTGNGADGALGPDDRLVRADGAYTTVDLATGFLLHRAAHPSITFEGGSWVVDGDLTIRATGDIRIRVGLQVSGTLTIVAGGALRIDGPRELSAHAMHLEAHGSDGVLVEPDPLFPFGADEPTLDTVAHDGAPAGPLEVWSRGPIDIQLEHPPQTEPSNDPTAVRVQEWIAEGDIVTGIRRFGGQPVRAGTRYGRIWSLGDVTLETLEVTTTFDSGWDDIDVRAGEDVLTSGYFRLNGYGYGSARLRAGRDVVFEQHAFQPPTGTATRTGGLTVHAGRDVAFLDSQLTDAYGGRIDDDNRRDVTFRAARDIHFAPLAGGRSPVLLGGLCAAGSHLTYEATRDIQLATFGELVAGNSYAFDEPCAPQPGGDLRIVAGQRLDLADSTIHASMGDPRGTVTTEVQPGFAVAPPDLQLAGERVVVSVPMDPKLAFAGVDLIATGPAEVEIQIGEGAPWNPAADHLGEDLPAGWRWRVRLPFGLFEGSALVRLGFDVGG